MINTLKQVCDLLYAYGRDDIEFMGVDGYILFDLEYPEPGLEKALVELGMEHKEVRDALWWVLPC